jgi:hypothetical protein
MDESTLKILLDNLEMSHSSLHGWLDFWTFLVVIGVALEVVFTIWDYRELLHDFRRGVIHSPEKPRVLLHVLGLLGAGLVAVGVAGELYVDVQAGKVETEIRSANELRVSLLIKEAGDAKQSATEAEEAAKRAKEASAEAIKKAEAVNGIAESANRVASAAQLQASGVKQTVDVVDKQVMTLRNQADEIRDEIAWRHVSPKEAEAIRDSIPASRRGFKIEVRHLLSDPEAGEYASEIADALRPILDVDGSSGYLGPWGTIPYGVGLYIKNLNMPGAADIQRALKAGGVEAPGALLSDAQLSSAAGIVIFVWPKPAPTNKQANKQSDKP